MSTTTGETSASTSAPKDTRVHLCAVEKMPRPMPKTPAIPEIVNALTALLEQAKNGRVVGVIVVVATLDANDKTIICGEFQDDLDYARAAAREGYDLLLGHWSAQAKDLRPHRPASAVIELSLPVCGHLRIV